MRERRSRSGAAFEIPRSRVMSTWRLAGITAVVLALLIMIFPERVLLDTLRHASARDPLAEQYLRELMRTGKRDREEIALLLAEQRLAHGDLDGAEETLRGLDPRSDAVLRRRLVLTEYRVLQARSFASPQQTRADDAVYEKMRTLLAHMVGEDWSMTELTYLAQQAAVHADPDVAARLYQRIAETHQPKALAALEEGSTALLARGEYRASAALLFAAKRVASTRDGRRRLFLKALTVLRSGNRLDEALASADENIGDLAEDDDTLVFLTRLALAANDARRAQVYARRLIRTHPGAAAVSLIERALDLLVTPVYAQADAALRPFDPEIYRLAYDVFLANGNLPEAYRLAAAAVLQRPEDLAWRERLAQTAEWSGRPEEALREWRVLADRGGSAAATQAILRLAPGLHDYDALLALALRGSGERRLSASEATRIAELYELAGRPDEAITFFIAHERRFDDAISAEALAGLYARTGRPDQAIAAYERVERRLGPDPRRALEAASLAMLRGRNGAAFATLERARDVVPPDEQAFWKLFGEVAWLLQEDAPARDAYQRLNGSGKASGVEIARLVVLLRERHPLEAARVAQGGWTRLREADLAVLALDLYAQERSDPDIGRVLASISATDEERLANQPQFFLLRAGYRARNADEPAALADYQRAIGLEPTGTDARVALLWFLLDCRRMKELSAVLAKYAAAARADPAYWSVYGAGYLALDRPAEALPFFRRELATKHDDYLWLQGYADALDADGKGAMALRVRRQAWVLLREAVARDPKLLERREDLLAYARLTTAQRPGDPALAAIRLVMREDKGASEPPDGARAARALDSSAKDLVASWALSTGQDEAAKTWLWRAYGTKLARPAWAEVSLALHEKDLDALDRLLASGADRLPPHDRVEAALALDRRDFAATLAFEAQSRRDADDDLHGQLSETARATASSLIARQTWFDYSPVQGTNTFLALPWWTTEHFRVAPFVSLTDQRSSAANAVAHVPGRDDQYGVSALLRYPHHQTEITAAWRDAFATFFSAQVAHTRALDSRLTGTLMAGYNLRAVDTSALFVAGMKDELRGALYYNFSKREYLNVAAAGQRFYTQTGAFLGSGARYDTEAGYRIRTEYPDLSVRLYAARQQYSASGAPDAPSARLSPAGTVPAGSFFLPPSFGYFSASLGFGDYLRGQPFIWNRFQEEPYSRAFRPFVTAGYTYNSILGGGYNLLAGAGGPACGNDYLALYYVHSDGGTGTFTTVREFVLRYQYFF